MAATLETLDKHLRFAWRNTPRKEVESYALDADWWEPRYDQPWRRGDVERRKFYGGETFAKPSPPVEGPNNPDRLARELKRAESALAYAEGEIRSAEQERFEALARIRRLKEATE